ncbi:hypothetical protein ACFL02_03595 [Planctomycetota bacterium]
MQGCKQFEQRLFYQISLDQLMPFEHLVRRLAGVLNSFWVRLAAFECNSHKGKP